MSLLDRIHSPKDIKCLTRKHLEILADEIRGRIIEVVKKNGGHLSSNLGIVELTIAIHRAFDSPRDKIIFDVSHQSYAHKLLTGRNDEKFLKLRSTDGYSGFFDPEESEHDCFVAGHAGTAISVALGFAYARDKTQKFPDSHVVAVIGDASLSCGMTMEALNNISTTTKKLIIIVNDNEFSIDKNVGAISTYLNAIIRSGFYNRLTARIKRILGSGRFGTTIIRQIRQIKRAIKGIFLPTSYFEYYGLRYFGPMDGHNISQLEEIFEFCKTSETPVLIHVKTTKGMGFEAAIHSPDKFHSCSPNSGEGELDICNSKKTVPYAEILGQELIKLSEADKKIVGVTAAMAYGTGMYCIREKFPNQYVDVGISEEHAVTFCAALAKAGMRPVCAIYSTFLQRSFDQILHDVCIQNLPVIFCLDRVGVSSRDGVTHHGLFDLSYLRLIPNSVILQPHGIQDFINIFHSAFSWNRPVFIRYPRSCSYENHWSSYNFSKFIELSKSEEIFSGEKVCLIALGNMIELANEVRNNLKEKNFSAGIINGRFIKPLDDRMLMKIYENYDYIVTMEDNVLAGGFGSAVLEFYNSKGLTLRVLRIGWPDKFVKHATTSEILRTEHGLSANQITDQIYQEIIKI